MLNYEGISEGEEVKYVQIITLSLSPNSTQIAKGS